MNFLNWLVTSVWLHNISLSNSQNEKNIESKKFKTPWTKQQKNFLARWFAFGFMDFHRFCCLLANLEVKLYLKLYPYTFTISWAVCTAFKCGLKLRISLWTPGLSSVWKSFNDQEINCNNQQLSKNLTKILSSQQGHHCRYLFSIERSTILLV